MFCMPTLHSHTTYGYLTSIICASNAFFLFSSNIFNALSFVGCYTSHHNVQLMHANQPSMIFDSFNFFFTRSHSTTVFDFDYNVTLNSSRLSMSIIPIGHCTSNQIGERIEERFGNGLLFSFLMRVSSSALKQSSKVFYWAVMTVRWVCRCVFVNNMFRQRQQQWHMCCGHIYSMTHSAACVGIFIIFFLYSNENLLWSCCWQQRGWRFCRCCCLKCIHVPVVMTTLRWRRDADAQYPRFLRYLHCVRVGALRWHKRASSVANLTNLNWWLITNLFFSMKKRK